MKVSHNWLQHYLKIDISLEKQLELLTDLGLEVEGTTPFESVKGSLKGVVVGEVISCEPHPNADRLRVTQINLGADEPVQIVCGAPNVAAGQKVPVATVGTLLNDADDNAFEIKNDCTSPFPKSKFAVPQTTFSSFHSSVYSYKGSPSNIYSP